MAEGKVISLGSDSITLGDQTILLETLEIYPTHLRLTVSTPEDNTAWLQDLNFYVLTDEGAKLTREMDGIVSFGAADYHSFHANSPYFFDPERVTITITDAGWLDKKLIRSYVNLETRETRDLPPDLTLIDVSLEENTWILSFEARNTAPSYLGGYFSFSYYDAQGAQQSLDRLGFSRLEKTSSITLYISDYEGSEVWLEPTYSHSWSGPPVSFTVEIDG